MKTIMKYILHILGIFIIGLVLFYLYPRSTQFEEHELEEKILFINSYSPDFDTFQEQIDGLNNVLHPENYDYSYLFMDTKRFPAEEMETLFYQELQLKKAVIAQYELIITADDNALNFVLKYYHEFFEGKPIVFFGVNNLDLALLQNQNPNITGVVENISIADNIDLIKDLFPKTKEIIAIADNTTTAQMDLVEFLSYQDKYQDLKLSKIDLSNLTYQQFLLEINQIQMDQNKIFILISALRDKENTSYSLNETLTQINANINVPIFHFWKHGIGNGLIGGKVISQYEQAVTAANIAKDILNGTDIATLPVIEESPNQLLFDYKKLKEYNRNPNDLPKNAKFINQPHARFREFIPELVITILTILFLIAWIFYLYKLNKEKEQALTDLEKSNLRNKYYLDSMFEGVLILNQKNQIEFLNQNAANIIGFSKEKLNGKSFNTIFSKFQPNQDINNLNYLLSLSGAKEQIGESFIYDHPTLGETYIAYKSKKLAIDQQSIGTIVNLENNNTINHITKKIADYQEIIMLINELSRIDINQEPQKFKNSLFSFIQNFLFCDHSMLYNLNQNIKLPTNPIANIALTSPFEQAIKQLIEEQKDEEFIFLDSNQMNQLIEKHNQTGILSILKKNQKILGAFLFVLPEKFEPSLDWWRTLNLLNAIMINNLCY